jgi:hypothetical protein
MIHDIMVSLIKSMENVNALKGRRMLLENAPNLIIRDLIRNVFLSRACFELVIIPGKRDAG